MCSRVTCQKCGKYTWSGCGKHLQSVFDGLSASQICTCPSKHNQTTSNSKK